MLWRFPSHVIDVCFVDWISWWWYVVMFTSPPGLTFSYYCPHHVHSICLLLYCLPLTYVSSYDNMSILCYVCLPVILSSLCLLSDIVSSLSCVSVNDIVRYFLLSVLSVIPWYCLLSVLCVIPWYCLISSTLCLVCHPVILSDIVYSLSCVSSCGIVWYCLLSVLCVIL